MAPTKSELSRERWEILERLDRWLEAPLIALAFVWLVLLVVEFLYGLSPALDLLGTVIWVVFVIDFAVRLLLAPDKLVFLRGNWLTAIALALPAMRILRFARVLRALRGIRLVRVITSLNRGMAALGAAMGRRGLGYVAALTLLVTFVGAAGMFAFEREAGLKSYGAALWWTAMIMTTMGSEYWPQSGEGRLLCLLLSIYAFAVFGYVTASIASFFVGRDAEDPSAEVAGAAELRLIRDELAGLRAEIQRTGRA